MQRPISLHEIIYIYTIASILRSDTYRSMGNLKKKTQIGARLSVVATVRRSAETAVTTRLYFHFTNKTITLEPTRQLVAHSQNGDHDVISTLCQLRTGTVRSHISGNTRITVYPLLYCGSWFLVHPASNRHTHWATRFHQLLLSSAASSNSSQLMPIFLRSLLTTSFQFCGGQPGLLLKPLGSHVRACRGSLW